LSYLNGNFRYILTDNCIVKPSIKNTLDWHKISRIITYPVNRRQKKLRMKFAIVSNLRVRKSRSYGSCHIVTGILDIFKPITASKCP
jgi:hypothetical protein